MMFLILINAPATFMSFINGVFKAFLDLFVIVFIDEILVYSKSKKEHADHLHIVLGVLRKHNLYAKIFSSVNFSCLLFPSLGMLL